MGKKLNTEGRAKFIQELKPQSARINVICWKFKPESKDPARTAVSCIGAIDDLASILENYWSMTGLKL